MKTLMHVLPVVAGGAFILLLLLVPSGSKAYPGTQTWEVTNDGWEYTARAFVPSPWGDVGGWAAACRDLPALPTRWTFTITIPEPSDSCEDPRCTETRFGVVLVGGDCYEEAPPEADDYVAFDYDACHGQMGLYHYRYLDDYAPVIPDLPFPDLPPGPHNFQIDRVGCDSVWTWRLFIDCELLGERDYPEIPATLGTYEFVNVYCSGVTFRPYEPFYPTPNPGANWLFDECGGSYAYDATGNCHTLTAVNGATFTPSGHTGCAAAFDGDDDRWETPDAADLRGMPGLTVEAWVFPLDSIPGNNQGILTKWGPGDSADDSYFLVRHVGSGELWGGINGTSRADVFGAQALPVGQWTHVALLYDGDSLSLYVNGVEEDGATPASVGPISNACFPVYVGRNDFDVQSGGSFFGYIDEPRIRREAVVPPIPSGIRDAGAWSEPPVTATSPNPFRSNTRIDFLASRAGPVEVRIFDSTGRLVRNISENAVRPGTYETSWDGTDNSGRPLRSGLYYYRVRVGDTTSRASMVLLR